MGFFLFYFILEIIQKSQIPSLLCFPLLCFHHTILFSFLIFFSFHSLKYWRTVNIYVNIPCKILSPPVLVDSTRFSLYAKTKVSRKPKHTHFKYWFQNIYFSCTVFPRSSTSLSDSLSESHVALRAFFLYGFFEIDGLLLFSGQSITMFPSLRQLKQMIFLSSFPCHRHLLLNLALLLQEPLMAHDDGF